MCEAQRSPQTAGDGEVLPESIIDAATDLIRSSGVARAPTTREVASALKIPAASLYRHFDNKDDLLDAVCARYLERLGRLMHDSGREVPTALERLHTMGLVYVRFAVETPLMYQLATGNLSRLGTKFDEALTSSAFVHLQRTVQELIDERFFPAGDSLEPALKMWATAHGVASLLITKPYLPWGVTDSFASGVLRAACLGHAVDGLDLGGLLPRRYNDPQPDTIQPPIMHT